MFKRPQKSDLERNLSQLMHDSRAELQKYWGDLRRKSGGLADENHPLFFPWAVEKADKLNAVAIDQAKLTMLQFVQQMELPASEIVGRAKLHLETLNTACSQSSPHSTGNATIKQYRAVFQQRLEGMLRDVAIGFVKGAGFTRAENMQSDDEWISAAEAVRLLKLAFNSELIAQRTICKRAHAGLIRSRAQKFLEDGVENIMENEASNRVDWELDSEFWWADGEAALEQNWTIGDFDTWQGQSHLEAFGVTFLRADIEKLIPATPPSAPASAPTTSKGGRPAADWWDDLWIEIARQLYVGDLNPNAKRMLRRRCLTGLKAAVPALPSARSVSARRLWQVIKDEN